MCVDCYDVHQDIFHKSGVNIEDLRRKLDQQRRSNCPGHHGLQEFVTDSPSFGCDVCTKRIAKGKKVYGCRLCNYDG